MKKTQRHIVKKAYKQGLKMNPPDVWCGASVRLGDQLIEDANHAVTIINNNGVVHPCDDCRVAFSKFMGDV